MVGGGVGGRSGEAPRAWPGAGGEDRVMRMHTVLMGLVLVALLATGCGVDLDIDLGDGVDGSGDVVTTAFDVEAFDRVEISSAFEADIRIVEGAEPSVEIETDDNLVDRVRARVTGESLEIGLRAGSHDPTELRATIVVGRLDSVEVSGAATVSVDGVSGSRFEVSASGASMVEVAGSVTEVEVEASGASDVDLDRLEAERATIDVSGATSVELTATERVTGEASGASSVEVGGGASVDVDTSGVSDVEID